MAKRAAETFVIALEDGKRIYQKDAVVPASVAKKVADTLTYDDGAKSPARSTAADD